ncbi:hypothetical protein HanHA300_Chr15g0555861 [Helianthus annuus]|nr:hypothetical protein HanHA300_Chr15g0555861 [Helianthus annuus]
MIRRFVLCVLRESVRNIWRRSFHILKRLDFQKFPADLLTACKTSLSVVVIYALWTCEIDWLEYLTGWRI